MFDQPNPIIPTEPTLPPDSSGKVEDIFNSFEPTAIPPAPPIAGPLPPIPPGGIGPAASVSPPPSPASRPASRPGGPGLIANKKFFIIGLSAVIVVVLAVGGWLAYARFFRTLPEVKVNLNQAPTNEAVNANQNVNLESETNLNINAPTTEIEPQPVEPVDTDGDGLTDDEEAQLSTDPTSVDTDNDGLFDREEVRVYKTDPSDADTDDDGYLDGAEVRAGYDPKGAGRLYGVETAQ